MANRLNAATSREIRPDPAQKKVEMLIKMEHLASHWDVMRVSFVTR